MTPAEEDIDVLWRGELVIATMLENSRSRLHPDNVQALEQLLVVLKKVRLDKAQRVSARIRAKRRRRAATTITPRGL